MRGIVSLYKPIKEEKQMTVERDVEESFEEATKKGRRKIQRINESKRGRKYKRKLAESY